MRRNYIILLILSVVFAAPGLSAYLFYAHPTWLHQEKTNRGEWLDPSIKLTKLHLESSKWAIVMWQPHSCDRQCIEKLNQLARVRLALGRRLYSIQLILLLNQDASEPSNRFKEILEDRDIQIVQLAHDDKKTERDLGLDGKVYIASPNHDLILAYASTANPGDVYHDIQKLLNK